MIEFLTLSLRNFLSYGNSTTVFDLHSPGTTLIVGENLDNTTHGEGSNGVGKSVLINAISYALFDKPVSDISRDNLINNQNNSNLEVTLTFRKDNRYYYVRRCRKMTKTKPAGTFVQLFERDDNTKFTDKDDTTLDSSANTTARIEAILGIPYELFVRIIVFSAMHMPFLDLPARTQVDIIEGLVGIRVLTEKGNALKELAKETVHRIELTEQNIKAQEAAKSDHFEHVRKTKERIIEWDIENEESIKALERKIAAAADIDFSRENKIHKEIAELQGQGKLAISQERNIQSNIDSERKRITNAQQTISVSREALETLASIDFEKEQKLYDERVLYQADERDLTHQLSAINTSVKRLEVSCKKTKAEVEHLRDAKCPYCHQNMPDAQKRLVAVEQVLEQEETELQDCIKQQTKLTKTLKTIQTKLDANLKRAAVDDITELNKLYTQSSVYEERITAGEQTIKECTQKTAQLNKELDASREKSTQLNEAVKELQQTAMTANLTELDELKTTNTSLVAQLKERTSAVNPFHKALVELEQEDIREPDYKQIDELQKIYEHQKFLIKVLTKKDSFIRKALLDRHLQYLNKRLQVYLHELGLPHRVEFTNNLTAKITEFDHVLDFGNLSNGQRARVNLALSLAFRDYLQSVHSQINVCLFDEVLDVGLDAIGVQLAAKVLQHKAHEEKSSLYIISHRDEITHSFDHRMVVTLQKGFSYVRNDF